MNQPVPKAGREIPTRVQSAVFSAKAWLLRLKRAFGDPCGKKPTRLKRSAHDPAAPLIAESNCPLYGSTQPEEFALQAGKVQNLRVAAQWLDGLHLPEGAIFSFWANVPRPTALRGFVKGRELREGCIIPSIGGGLCQLSNAIHEAALKAGFEIVERHRHSRKMPGAMQDDSRDATIFWNYVDLRFRATVNCQMEVVINRSELIVRIRGAAKCAEAQKTECVTDTGATIDVESCETCGMVDCFRHKQLPTWNSGAITAWLVDAWWPEYDEYLRKNRRAEDWLFTPLDSTRLRLGPYRWDSDGFAKIVQTPVVVAVRSWRSRKLAAQGAQRQLALLEMDEKLAARYAAKIPARAMHLVISQNLLPHLWQAGVLGGRTFDVLMTRLPLAHLQGNLDRAAAKWPESPTIADYRAPAALVEQETAALAEAGHWITPHSAIARIAGARAIKLDWQLPAVMEKVQPAIGADIFFPASTLARKGACEVREVVRALSLGLVIGGPVLESPAFWDGIDPVVFGKSSQNWPSDVMAVVLPAWVENQPRRLLAAIAAGLPVIASEHCGLAGLPGVTELPAGDMDALQDCLAGMMGQTKIC